MDRLRQTIEVVGLMGAFLRAESPYFRLRKPQEI